LSQELTIISNSLITPYYSLSSTKDVLFLDKKLDKGGCGTSSYDMVEAFLDCISLGPSAPLLLREKVCAVSPSLIISPVDSVSSPSQEGPKASDDKEHLKEFPYLLGAQPNHRGPFPRTLRVPPNSLSTGIQTARCYVQKKSNILPSAAYHFLLLICFD